MSSKNVIYFCSFFFILCVKTISTQFFSNEKCWNYAPNTLRCNHEENETLIDDLLVNPKEFPHIAFVTNLTEGSFCIGSLISERYVLLAGHCGVRSNPGTLITLGVRNRNTQNISKGNDMQEFHVSETIIHPQYRPPSKYYDVALIRLDRDVQFTDHVRPICLNTDASLRTTKGFIAGVDFINEDGDENEESLWKSPVNLVPFNSCNQSYSANTRQAGTLRSGISPQTHVCVEPVKDDCLKYQGGPLQIYNQKIRCMYTLIGISSFGYSCLRPGSPDAFTRIYPFIPWIELNIWY